MISVNDPKAFAFEVRSITDRLAGLPVSKENRRLTLYGYKSVDRFK